MHRGLSWFAGLLLAMAAAAALAQDRTAFAGGQVQVITSPERDAAAIGQKELLAIFLMPINMAFWGGLHPTGSKLLERIELSAADMLVEVGIVIGVPFVLGLTIRHFAPRAAAIAHRIVGPVSFLALAAIIVIGVANNWDIFIHYIGVVLLAVFLHDALALLLGYGIGRGTRLPLASTKAMTFEVGIRNAGLGLLLVFTYFDGLGGMALVAAWWGIWDIIAGLAVATVWRRRAVTPEQVPA